MSKRSTKHATFTIERRFAVPPARVFAAYADAKAKARWFGGPDEWEKKSNLKVDFRVGGRESVSGGPPGGPVHFYNALYQDIVPNRRVVTASTMALSDKRISASLVTVELLPTDQGTDLICTHQGAFFEGADGPQIREAGWRTLIDKLATELSQ